MFSVISFFKNYKDLADLISGKMDKYYKLHFNNWVVYKCGFFHMQTIATLINGISLSVAREVNKNLIKG